jgi:hypothetical protein
MLDAIDTIPCCGLVGNFSAVRYTPPKHLNDEYDQVLYTLASFPLVWCLAPATALANFLVRSALDLARWLTQLWIRRAASQWIGIIALAGLLLRFLRASDVWVESSLLVTRRSIVSRAVLL